MSIHLANEYPTVLVAEPRRNCHKINSGHNAKGTKKMAQIMKSDPFNSRRFPRDFQTLAKTSRVFVSGPTPWRRKKPRAIGCTSRMHFTQKRSQLRIKFHSAALPIFRQTIGTDCDALALEIYIRPFNAQSFLFTCSAKGEEAQIIRQL